MPGMPYHLEKGPFLAVIEDYVNADLGRCKAALVALRGGTPLPEIGAVDSPALDASPPPLKTSNGRKDHLYRHWFGWVPNQSGGYSLDPSAKQTGKWANWKGPAEPIVRETLKRALEVSLGIPHGDPVPQNPSRHWPIEMFWKCPQPWFEGWVGWRGQGARGQVTLIFATPGNGAHVYEQPTVPANKVNKVKDYEENPRLCNHDRGLWVTTSKKQTQVPYLGWESSGEVGTLLFPGFGAAYESDPAIITVATSFPDGGVLHGGYKYLAPT